MHESGVTIREMRPDEATSLYRLAKASFTLMEALGASKPKQAVVAMLDGEVVGAAFMKIMKGKNGEKIGYLDLGFVLREHRGKGIAGLLYPAATKWLRDAGCAVVSAMVKDDNVASWGQLQKQGFATVGYMQFARVFGFLPGLLIWLRTIYCIACGMNFWTDQPMPPKSSSTEMLSFLGINVLFMLLRQGVLLLRGMNGLWHELPAGLLVLCFSILVGWIGTRLTGRSWRFGVVRGGLLISLPLMVMGTFFPIVGRWYPQTYDRTPAMKKTLGLEALVSWVCMLALYLVAFLVLPSVPFWRAVSDASVIFLVFHVLAFFPFEHFGGKRVFDWSPVLFFGMAAVTCVSFFIS